MFTKVIGKTNEPDDSGQGSYSPAAQPQRPPAPAPSGSTEVAPAVSSGTGSNVRNILSSDVEITGSVKFTNDLLVDGRIDGEITSTGNLTIGENAKIRAEIKTASVIIHGKVHGNITVADRVELRAGSEVVGDIKAKILLVEATAIFVGKSEVGVPTSIPAGQTVKPAETQTTAETTKPAAAAPTKAPAANAPKPNVGGQKPVAEKPKQAGGAQQGTLAGTDT